MTTGAERRELAAFLRSRRRRRSPADAGLVTGRRRSPGLRREDVAALAGVSVTWCSWLEQARDINPSEQVLGSLARALALDEAQTAHLFRLAGTGRRSASSAVVRTCRRRTGCCWTSSIRAPRW